MSFDLTLEKAANDDLKLRVNTVHEKGTVKYTVQDSLDESGGESHINQETSSTLTVYCLGGNLNAASRQALMQKLARTEPATSLPELTYVTPSNDFIFSLICGGRPRPNIPQTMQSRSVLLKDMFNPEE